MKVHELIDLLKAMPQDAEVERPDWICGGDTHHDELVTQGIDKVLAPPNEHSQTAVVID